MNCNFVTGVVFIAFFIFCFVMLIVVEIKGNIYTDKLMTKTLLEGKSLRDYVEKKKKEFIEESKFPEDECIDFIQNHLELFKYSPKEEALVLTYYENYTLFREPLKDSKIEMIRKLYNWLDKYGFYGDGKNPGPARHYKFKNAGVGLNITVILYYWGNGCSEIESLGNPHLEIVLKDD